jgi:hypothetical protein
MAKSRAWFEARVKELADVLRGLPKARQQAILDAIEAEAAAEEHEPPVVLPAETERRQKPRRRSTGRCRDRGQGRK